MAEMADMPMPLPANTAPMMGGDGPFGSIGMGGMFSVVKVRAEQKPGDYRDPGWYKHSVGTQAHEWRGPLPEPVQQQVPTAASASNLEVQVRKPSMKGMQGMEGMH
jgi:hypothetical protein